MSIVTNGDHEHPESGSRRSSSPCLGRPRGESIIKLQKLRQMISIPRLDHKVNLEKILDMMERRKLRVDFSVCCCCCCCCCRCCCCCCCCCWLQCLTDFPPVGGHLTEGKKFYFRVTVLQATGIPRYFTDVFVQFKYVCIVNLNYSRRQYKVSVPLKKNRCPTAYQRLKKRNRFYGVYMLTIFTRHFLSNSAQIHQ